MENELHDATEERRKLTVERRKAGAERLGVSNTSKAVLGERTVSGVQSSLSLKVKLDLTLRAVQEVRKKKGRALVRKEAADTQE